jgi:hypothetical protein
MLRYTAIFAVGLLTLVGCSSDQPQQDAAPPAAPSDREAIQTALNEIQARWRYGDKGVLYENELSYLRDAMSFDEYLERKEIVHLEADSMVAMNATDIEFHGRDSALAKIEVVFVGPTGDTTRLTHESMFYNYKDTWLRPSISHPSYQGKHDELRRIADSSAAAEENEEW